MTIPDTDHDDSPVSVDAPPDDALPNRRERRRLDRQGRRQARREERAKESARRRQGPAASLFGADPDVEEADQDESAGDGDYIADRGQWDDLKGPTPRGLRRNRFLDRFGWFEVIDRDATITSTPQVVATTRP